jgi:hypothetical protein
MVFHRQRRKGQSKFHALASDLEGNKRAPEYHAPKKERSYSGAEQRRLFE